MKRTNKIISMFLIWAMLLTGCYAVLTSIGVKLNKQTQTVSAGTNAYTEDFGYAGFKGATSTLSLGSNNWAAGDAIKTKAAGPTISNGVASFVSKQAMSFTWKSLVSYSTATTYKFTFDFKIISADDSSETFWDSDSHTRAMFVALDGNYNLIEINNKDGKVKLANSSATSANATYNKSPYEETYLTGQVELNNTTATVKIYNNNNVILEGSRSITVGSTISFRCEDGAFELDNFVFSDGQNIVRTESFNSEERVVTNKSNIYWTRGDLKRPSGKTPIVEDEKLKFTTGQNIEFNWGKYVTHNSSTTYTITFNFKVTDKGNGTNWDAAECTRAMFVSFGGWYNLIEMSDINGKIKLGGSTSFDYGDYLSAKIVLSGTSVTTTIYSNTGSSSGTTKTATRTIKLDGYATRIAFRCEDGAFQIDDFKFTDGTKTYTENFSLSKSATYLNTSGVWKQGDERKSTNAPTISSGVLKLSSNQGAQVRWQKYAGYDSSKEYVFTFYFTITNKGSGNVLSGSSEFTRALYVAFGGEYNLIEINNKENQVNIAEGGKTTGYSDSTYKDKKVKAQIVLSNKRANITLFDSGGGQIITGHRDFGFDVAKDSFMPYLAFRCEDGAVSIDDFSLVVEDGHDYVSSATSEYLKSAATCTTKAVYYKSCSRCKVASAETFTSGSALGHSPNSTCTWDTNHTKATVSCSRSGCSQTWSGTATKTTTTTATCTTKEAYKHTATFSVNGTSKIFTCSGHTGSVNSSNHTGSSVNGGTASAHTKYSCCGATISTEHSYTVDSGVQYTAATCTAKRKNYLKCSCGYNPQSSSYVIEIGSANGHSWSAWSSTGESQHSRSCTVCKVSETQDHSLSDWITTDASNHYKTCSVCSAKVQQSTHNYDNSCDTSCNTCNHIREITHSYNEYGYTEDGHWQICGICGNNGSIEEHSFGEWEVIVPPTLDSDGVERRTCKICDYYKEQSASSSNTASLTVKGTIGLNLYIDIEKYTSAETAYVELEYNHNAIDYNPDYKITRITELEGVKHSDGTYKFTISFASGQIADQINLRLYDGQGVLKYEKNNYSILAYCKEVIASNADNDLKNLCKSIINYGIRAIDYFDYDANLPNATNTYLETLQGAPTEIPTLQQQGVGVLQSQATNLSFNRYSLLALSEISIRTYFTIDNGYDLNSYDITLSSTTDSEMSYKTGYNDYGYFVEVYGIESANIDALFTITLTFKGDSKTTTITYSALHYVEKVLKETTNQELKDMCIAIYQYNLCAKAYFTNENPWEIF